MRVRNVVYVVTIALFAVGCTRTALTGEVTVEDAWARPATVDAPGASAAYMVINNGTANGVRLVGVSSDVAGMAEIHLTQMDGDIMQMRPVDGIDIPSGSSASLEPGGYHVMLMGLSDDLIEGEDFSLTLLFESGEEIRLDVSIEQREGS